MKFLTAMLLVLFMSVSSAMSASTQLEWVQNPDVTEVFIYQRTVDSVYNYENPIWSGTDNIANIENLDDNGIYYFVLRSKNYCDKISLDSEEIKVDVRSEFCKTIFEPGSPTNIIIKSVSIELRFGDKSIISPISK